MGNALHGGRPTKAQQQADQRTAELQRQGQSDSTSEAIRSAIPSLGFSLGSMAAAIPAGLAGAAATQAAIPIPGSGLVGGALAAGAASGVAGYRIAGSQFLNDYGRSDGAKSQKQRGRGLTEQEKRPRLTRSCALSLKIPDFGRLAQKRLVTRPCPRLGRVALGLMPKARCRTSRPALWDGPAIRTGCRRWCVNH